MTNERVDELHLSQSQDQNIQILEFIIYQFKKQHNTDKVQIIGDDENVITPQQLFSLPHAYLITPGINLTKDPTFVRDIKYIYKPAEESCLIEKYKGKRKLEQTTMTYGSIKAILNQQNENPQQYQAKAPVMGQSLMQTKFEAPLLSNEEVAQRIKVNVKGGQIQFAQLPRPQRQPRAITAKEVMEHDKPNDCWTVYNGKVYDITKYLDYHPGGRDKLFLGAGKDCTRLFNQFHPWVNGHAFLEKDYLGPLKG